MRTRNDIRASGMVTVTGVDEFTNIGELSDLMAAAPVEVGVLYSASRDSMDQGTHRYPRREWIVDFLNQMIGKRVAVHICGQAARKELLSGGLFDAIYNAERVQINGIITPKEARAALEALPGVEVIFQRRLGNEWIGRDVSSHFPEPERVSFLIDDSGGRGISPAKWQGLPGHSRAGFAGGLGPDNLRQEFPSILRQASHFWWIDAETKLRDASDRFDLEKVKAFTSTFSDFINADSNNE